MRLAPSQEQLAFAAVLHAMLAGADLPKVAAAWADGDPGPGRALWSALAGAGVTGLLVPEHRGGAGAGPDDLVIACEELGHHAVPGPVAESLAAVPSLLSAAPPGATEWLPTPAQGRVIASLVAPPWLPFAVDGDSADLILVVDGADIRQGRAGRVRPSLYPARRLSEVDRGPVIVTGQDPGPALELGTLACSAQLLGAARALLEMSVEHARKRAQFGRAIGSFQAVQHRLADVSVAIEFARPLLYAAAAATGRSTVTTATGPGTPATATGPGAVTIAVEAGAVGSARVDVSAAKVACGAAARQAARAALQVHGAVGYTREHGLWRWLGLVRVLDLGWGTPSWHRARILSELADGAAGDHTDQPGGRRTAGSGQTAAWSRRDGVDPVGSRHARTGKEGL
ncbi:acyl-CoA dehydrogenase family protein [Actinoplanes sp. NPDC049802]|uniref:acyl-CoA dehydrogenase family protein n=1 Tax=Actinoplanes sp. NPDC049802 TaxID=3154742 RepID=UPI0033EA42AC